LTKALANVATKDDIRQLQTVIENLTNDVFGKIQSGTMTLQDAAHVASSLVSSVVAPPSHWQQYPYMMRDSRMRQPNVTVVQPIMPPEDEK